jgi:hypothetical protein
MINQHTLNLIVDTTISQTYTVRVSFDAANTPEMICTSGHLFAPADLSISWVKPNGGVWRPVLLTLSGGPCRIEWNMAASTYGNVPQWIWDIVSETKPKE